MHAIRWWARPAILVLLWLVLAATTAAELATVGPTLTAAAPAAVRATATRPAARVRTFHARRMDGGER
jgi:hypothetical protein